MGASFIGEARRWGLAFAVIPGILAVVGLFSGNLADWWIWSAVAALFVVAQQVQDHAVTPENPEAAYLVSRFRAAVDEAARRMPPT